MLKLFQKGVVNLDFNQLASTLDTDIRIKRAQAVSIEIESYIGHGPLEVMEFGCGTGLISLNLKKKISEGCPAPLRPTRTGSGFFPASRRLPGLRRCGVCCPLWPETRRGRVVVRRAWRPRRPAADRDLIAVVSWTSSFVVLCCTTDPQRVAERFPFLSLNAFYSAYTGKSIKCVQELPVQAV